MSYYIGEHVSDAVSIVTDFNNKSNNVIVFDHLLGANLETFIDNSSIIYIESQNGPNVYSEIISVNGSANTITLASNVILTYSNVAVVTGASGQNTLNITSLTGKYDLMNNGNYKYPAYPIRDIVYVGDTILVDNNTSKIVKTVDYLKKNMFD